MADKSGKSPLAWVPSAYFAMGLPFVMINVVCVLMFSGLGLPDSKVALWTSLLLFPWTLKFLWSPLLELLPNKRLVVSGTQIISGVGFALVAMALHLPDFFAVSVAVLAVVAFSGATHDVGLDGLYMSDLSETDQAKFIGWQGAFYNLAKVLASGALVWIAGTLMNVRKEAGATSFDAALYAWTIIMAVAGILLIVLGVYHRFILPEGRRAEGAGQGSVWEEMKVVLGDFFKKKYIWLYIAFIILYRFAEGFAMKIVPLFLKAEIANGGLGLSEQQFGLYYGTFGAVAFIIGSLLGGYYVAYRGLKKSLVSLICIFNVPFLVYAYLAVAQPDSTLIIVASIVFEYFTYGMGFVGLTLFMMQQVAPGKHQMAHYAFASAIMNLSVMMTGSISGFISDAIGYKMFFLCVIIAAVPVFIMSLKLPFTYDVKGTKDMKKSENQ